MGSLIALKTGFWRNRSPMKKPHWRGAVMGAGGETGIRTLGTIAGTTVFETAPIDRSGISPGVQMYGRFHFLLYTFFNDPVSVFLCGDL